MLSLSFVRSTALLTVPLCFNASRCHYCPCLTAWLCRCPTVSLLPRYRLTPPPLHSNTQSKAVVAVAVAKKESKEVSLVGNEDMYLPGTPKGARRPRAFEYSDSDSDNDYV